MTCAPNVTHAFTVSDTAVMVSLFPSSPSNAFVHPEITLMEVWRPSDLFGEIYYTEKQLLSGSGVPLELNSRFHLSLVDCSLVCRSCFV